MMGHCQASYPTLVSDFFLNALCHTYSVLFGNISSWQQRLLRLAIISGFCRDCPQSLASCRDCIHDKWLSAETQQEVKHNHTDSLGRKPFLPNSSLRRKQGLTEGSGEARYEGSENWQTS